MKKQHGRGQWGDIRVRPAVALEERSWRGRCVRSTLAVPWRMPIAAKWHVVPTAYYARSRRQDSGLLVVFSGLDKYILTREVSNDLFRDFLSKNIGEKH